MNTPYFSPDVAVTGVTRQEAQKRASEQRKKAGSQGERCEKCRSIMTSQPTIKGILLKSCTEPKNSGFQKESPAIFSGSMKPHGGIGG